MDYFHAIEKHSRQFAAARTELMVSYR
jgi:hypothetical protein